MPKKKRFLFVFEPYEWCYCGGAIGVIAETYDEAVELIVKSSSKYEKYERKFFSKSEECFKKDHYDQWLLTDTIEVNSSEQSRIVFNNWNYS